MIQGYNIHMWNRIKKLLGSTAFNIFLIVFLAGIVIWFTMRKDGKEILAMLGNASIPMILGLVALMVFERLILGWSLKLECNQTYPHYTLKQGFINAYTAGLFCNITPGASGGQVAQGYIFRKQGIPLTSSIGILWLDFIVYQSTMTVFVLALILLRFSYFYTNFSRFFLIVLAGFAVSAGIIVFLFFLANSPRFYTWLTTTGLKIGHKLHIVKNIDEAMANLDKALYEFNKEIVVLRTHKKMIVLLSVSVLIRLIIYYSIPFFCAKALRIPVGYDQLLDIIALSSYVAMINAFLPMPGSAGGTEATFILMFSTIFTRTDAASIMILWRSITFYQTLIIGGLVFLYGKTRKDIPLPTTKELPRTYAAETLKEEIAGL